MPTPTGSEGVAFNPATASENRIHSDAVARQYGFRGGLVPGVTIYACLVEPALRAWGLRWLSGGGADVVLHKPVYEGERFRVEVEPEGEAARCALYGPGGVLCASGSVRAPESAESAERAPAPRRRGDPPAPHPDARPEATRESLEVLRERGLGAIRVLWDGTGEQARYRNDPRDMPDLVRSDREGFAHPGFTLGLANWVLSRNVRLGPWIHVESRVCHHGPVSLHEETVTEARILDLFERRGHEFVDLDVAVFGKGDRPLLSAFHRAIYRLREPGTG